MTYATEEIREVRCPKCGGHCWDNRITKTNPKAPDFKCKDKQCDGVIWPEKEKKGVPQPQAKPLATEGKGPYAEETPVVRTPTVAQLDSIFSTYSACFAFAHKLAHDKLGQDASHEGICAMAATTFIAASKL